jgi:hypothetical protein
MGKGRERKEEISYLPGIIIIIRRRDMGESFFKSGNQGKFHIQRY